MRTVVAAILALAVTACGGGGALATPPPRPLALAELKYRVIDAVGAPWTCDPDFYPIARADERDLAHGTLPQIQGDAATYSAILARLRIAPSAQLTADQELAVYREWKTLGALRLEAEAAHWKFSVRVMSRSAPSGNAKDQGEQVDGTVDSFGAVAVSRRTPVGPPACPICLARGTRIATPNGERAVEELRPGDLVWTSDARGARLVAPVIAVGNTPVPDTHEVVRVVLDDGRTVLASPGHPTADGRSVGALAPGDGLDGARVRSAERLPYLGGATFDLLPAGPTGAYWANGVLLGSTLHRAD